MLILKKSKPSAPVEFRPINLCNVVYKIVFKTLVNRLKLWLSSLISPSQLAFVAGRSIFDNIVTTHEVAHAMHAKRISRIGFVICGC